MILKMIKNKLTQYTTATLASVLLLNSVPTTVFATPVTKDATQTVKTSSQSSSRESNSSSVSGSHSHTSNSSSNDSNNVKNDVKDSDTTVKSDSDNTDSKRKSQDGKNKDSNTSSVQKRLNEMKPVKYSANPQLADAQKEFTLLQNQMDYYTQQIKTNKKQSAALQDKLAEDQLRKQKLDEQYRKLIQAYQDENTSPFLSWLYSILPFLKPANYDTDTQAQVLKNNRELSKKMDTVKTIIEQQQDGLKENRVEQQKLLVKLRSNKKRLSKNIDKLQHQIKTNVSGLTDDQINAIKKQGNLSQADLEKLQMETASASKSISKNPEKALANAKTLNVSSTTPNSDIGYVFGHDLRTPAGVTADQLARGLQGNEKALAPAIVKYSHENGLNSIFVAALIAEESGWANNDSFGLKNNIMSYRGQTFSSREECIKFVTQKIRQDYLTSNGQYFHGYNLAGVSKMYNLGSTSWVNAITRIGESIAASAYR